MTASDDKPVVVVATFRPLPASRTRAIDALREAAARVHAEPGCELYALHEAEDRLVLVEKWSSAEALGVHGKAPALQDLNEALDGLLSEPVDIAVLSALPAGDPSAGAL